MPGTSQWSRRVRALVLAWMVTVPMMAAPRAQAPAAPPPLRQSLQSLERLLARVPNRSIDMNFAEFRARLAVSRLQELAANWPAESPADYRLNLDREVRLLEQGLATTEDARLTSLLEALADDLEVKLEHCKASGGKLGGNVTVRVRTVSGDQEVRNWQVFYLPKVFETNGNATPDRFPQLSSPTHETLVPGRYVMWVRESSGETTGQRVVVKVGEGKSELLLDLPVPAATGGR